VDGRTALSVALTLGRATAPAWAMLAEAAGHGTGRLRLTPWRGVIIPGLDPGIAPEQLAVLGGAGFLTSSDAPAAGVSACAGRPGCAQSLADVHAAAAAAFGAESGSAATRLPLHWSGCERRCGHPAGPRVEVVAQPGDHYRLERHDAASPSTPRDGACCTTTAVSKAAVSRAVAAARRHA
jgi:precorrin-3B synthase